MKRSFLIQSKRFTWTESRAYRVTPLSIGQRNVENGRGPRGESTIKEARNTRTLDSIDSFTRFRKLLAKRKLLEERFCFLSPPPSFSPPSPLFLWYNPVRIASRYALREREREWELRKLVNRLITLDRDLSSWVRPRKRNDIVRVHTRIERPKGTFESSFHRLSVSFLNLLEETRAKRKRERARKFETLISFEVKQHV